MMEWTVLRSGEDRSVNFVLPLEEGSIETRYVRRCDDYFIVYLSSHTGCKHACRFCHLTTTGQTYFEPVTVDLYLEQALRVFSHYDAVADAQGAATRVNFNFMARGEALSNPHFIADGFTLTGCLASLARERGLCSRFHVSTIIPQGFNQSLVTAFGGLPLEFYYSIYSVRDDFRKRWLPRAKPVRAAMSLLADWQHSQHREVVLHWAFIAGENDSEHDVHAICDLVDQYGLHVRVNVVRYNPPNDKSQETALPLIERNLAIIRSRLADSSKIVRRVGKDIFASCGQFVSED